MNKKSFKNSSYSFSLITTFFILYCNHMLLLARPLVYRFAELGEFLKNRSLAITWVGLLECLDLIVLLFILRVLYTFILALVQTWIALRGWIETFKPIFRLTYPFVFSLRLLRWLGVPGLSFGLFSIVFAAMIGFFHKFDPTGLRQRLFFLGQDWLDYLNPWLARRWVYYFFLGLHQQGHKLLIPIILGLSLTRLLLIVNFFRPFLEQGTQTWFLFVTQVCLGLLLSLVFLLTLASWIFSPFALWAANFQESWGYFYNNLWPNHPEYARRPTPCFVPGEKGFSVEERVVRRHWLLYWLLVVVCRITGHSIPSRERVIVFPHFSSKGFLYYRELGADYRYLTYPKGFFRELGEANLDFRRIFGQQFDPQRHLVRPPRR